MSRWGLIVLYNWRILVVAVAQGLITVGISVVDDALQLPPHTVTDFLVRFGLNVILIVPFLLWARNGPRQEKPPPAP